MDAPAPSAETAAEAPAQSATAEKDAARAKILSEHKKAKAVEQAQASENTDEPKPEPGETEKPKPKPVNRGKFTKQIAELTAKLEAAGKDTKAEFLKALRADPGLLFREISDDPEIMVKLAEARQLSLDPVEQAKREGERVLKEIDKRREDAENAEKSAKAKAAEANTLAAVGNILRVGIKRDDGTVIVGAKWPVAEAMAGDGEDVVWASDKGEKLVATVPEAVLRTFKVLRDGLGRAVDETETATLLEIALDKIEARLAGHGKYHRKGDPKAEPKPASGAPKTISSRGVPGRPASRVQGAPKGATKEERKVAILETYRQQRLRERANAETA